MGEHYDVIIIGAGPAGLAAAFELSSISNLSILVMDEGQSIDERKCASVENLCIDHRTCNITHGSGGAGLYSDGKLCLDPKIGGDISRFYDESETKEMMRRVTDMLSMDSEPIRPAEPDKKNISSCVNAFNDIGLGFKYYDVVRMGLQSRVKSVEAIERYLHQKGVRFLFDTKAMGISSNDRYAVSTGSDELSCDYLVVAPGKIGSNWFDMQCRKLGIPLENNPLLQGVRLEMPRDITLKLSEITDNPRISMEFENGDYIKTHCFSDKGRVTIADYGGMKLVEGNYLENAESGNSSVNVVMRLNLPPYITPFTFSSGFIQLVNSFGKGRPVVQTVGDLSDFSETNPSALEDIALKPTLNDCRCGDLSKLYSAWFADRFSKFIQRIDLVLPGFADRKNLVFAPFFEWWMRKADVDRHFETRRPGLYAVGDGAGLSQGIIAAGMQGIACARGISDKSSGQKRFF
ncbi:hypothetical protein COV19_04650 [Candidatus Woesearchaeota archaeon CG10_big_fil_rev_8_21_14_0_10_44_13]|nr:MAG: hypothetical protein COV19_04650 [Candidatus Woesearchaeota archaeon CG10_big_fil_rev_8_21_14_0_10_44_13]